MNAVVSVTGLFIHCSATDKQRNKMEYVKMRKKIEDSKKKIWRKKMYKISKNCEKTNTFMFFVFLHLRSP
jgi:hypothetical protein